MSCVLQLIILKEERLCILFYNSRVSLLFERMFHCSSKEVVLLRKRRREILPRKSISGCHLSHHILQGSNFFPWDSNNCLHSWSLLCYSMWNTEKEKSWPLVRCDKIVPFSICSITSHIIQFNLVLCRGLFSFYMDFLCLKVVEKNENKYFSIDEQYLVSSLTVTFKEAWVRVFLFSQCVNTKTTFWILQLL